VRRHVQRPVRAVGVLYSVTAACTTWGRLAFRSRRVIAVCSFLSTAVLLCVFSFFSVLYSTALLCCFFLDILICTHPMPHECAALGADGTVLCLCRCPRPFLLLPSAQLSRPHLGKPPLRSSSATRACTRQRGRLETKHRHERKNCSYTKRVPPPTSHLRWPPDASLHTTAAGTARRGKRRAHPTVDETAAHKAYGPTGAHAPWPAWQAMGEHAA